MPELVRTSSHVFLATAVQHQARTVGSRKIVTDVELRVDEPLKGPVASGDTVTLTCLGGKIGSRGMHVEGEPRFAQDAQTIVFARQGVEYLRPVGMAQGVLPVRSEGGLQMVVPSSRNLTLVRRTPSGQLVPSPSALPSARPLSEVMAEIRYLARSSK